MKSHIQKKKVIFITGASSGFGKVCAEYLNEKGHIVYGSSRKISTQQFNYNMVHLDINESGSVKSAVSHILSIEKRIDVLINNAGLAIAGAVEDTSLTELKAQLETNFFGAVRVCKEIIPVMRKNNYGYIINISSIAGLIAVPYQSAYSASKFALEGFIESVRMEIKPLYD